jgi:hypothetical protein
MMEDMIMRNGMMVIAIGSFAVLLASGCVQPASDPESQIPPTALPDGSDPVDAGAILSIEIENGHTVTFYEPAPGGLYFVERISAGQRFVLGERDMADALTAFARLRPQTSIPEALQAAYDRARNLASDLDAEVAPSFGGGAPETAGRSAAAPGTIEQGLTSSSSAANFVNNDGGCNWGPTWSFCRVNWANGFFAFTTAISGLCIVDHYAGNGIVNQITVGTTITSLPQAVHTSIQFSLGARGANVLRRLDITNATGDSFHVGCRWGV